MNQPLPLRTETAFVFQCQGDDLIGVLHAGDPGCDIGVLTIVAGGPQYRGGVARQLVRLGRRLASVGVPVMRFDHRGLGDSEGEFKGFRFIHDDLLAAIAEFKSRAPAVRRIILWGGCDSASAALINAWKLPDVACVIAGNPFVSSPATASIVRRKHYLSRLGQASFWVKLLRGQYDIGGYFAAAWRKIVARLRGGADSGVSGKVGASGGNGNFIDEILKGLQKFDGKILFLMGDRFLLSDEFDELIVSSPAWKAAYGKPGYERIDIKGGDQVFSGYESQERLFDVATRWIQREFQEK